MLINKDMVDITKKQISSYFSKLGQKYWQNKSKSERSKIIKERIKNRDNSKRWANTTSAERSAFARQLVLKKLLKKKARQIYEKTNKVMPPMQSHKKIAGKTTLL